MTHLDRQALRLTVQECRQQADRATAAAYRAEMRGEHGLATAYRQTASQWARWAA